MPETMDGLAAALSVRKDIQPRAVPVPEAQEALRKDGVDLARGGEEQDPNMLA